MQIVRITGGLGNQLFQYAFGQALSKRNNCDVLYDISRFKNVRLKNEVNSAYQHIVYCLKLYKTNIILASDAQINALKSPPHTKTESHNSLKRLLGLRKNVANHYIDVSATGGIFYPSVFKLQGDYYFWGFFQSEKYFLDYRDDIIRQLTLDIPLDDKNKKMLEHIISTNAVSLHIRRGDYLNNSNWNLPSSYYDDAIKYLTYRYNNLHFYIFSNDTKWVFENLKIDAPFTVVDVNPPNKGYYDIELMRNCKHNIIANSTFSWWGAWLNINPEKIVVAPFPWFRKKGMFEDIIPDSWIKIQHD